jgi:hypothetical protein
VSSRFSAYWFLDKTMEISLKKRECALKVVGPAHSNFFGRMSSSPSDGVSYCFVPSHAHVSQGAGARKRVVMTARGRVATASTRWGRWLRPRLGRRCGHAEGEGRSNGREGCSTDKPGPWLMLLMEYEIFSSQPSNQRKEKLNHFIPQPTHGDGTIFHP